ncbi:hypothetical protein HKX69_32940 [Streptomyces argyrophyllae]|uniref:DUF732 domain-containing protein n=1 Tax=Streptomyces argyrophylli TaxID=2726118 RepID=A0A6M4PYC6_9ACTN|nr:MULTISPECIES: hypothetical protein [Streptomyces]QJS13720.1 hypothetical protein HKX69_32940 [Streptomyces argyrophyllae]
MKRSVPAVWAFVFIACAGVSSCSASDDDGSSAAQEETEEPYVDDAESTLGINDKSDREETYLFDIVQTFDMWGSKRTDETEERLIKVGWKACRMIVDDGMTEDEVAAEPDIINEVKAIRDSTSYYEVSPTPQGVDSSNASQVATRAHERLCRDDFDPQLL